MANETKTDARETERQLNEALDKKGEKAEKWTPEKGSRMICEFVGSSQGKSDDTRHLTFLTLKRVSDGKEYSVLQDSVLENVFAELKVTEGDILGVEFLGWQENKKGKIDKRTGEVVRYKNWKVVKK